MKLKLLKKILLYTVSTVVLLLLVLFLHIYLVYRPRAPDANTRVMARIDIKQPISQDQANQIKTWMTHQNGIDHVLVNQQSQIVVFTFFPIKTTGNQIVKNFQSTFNLKSDRFMPTAKELSSGCPAAGSSYTYKIYKLITHLI